jgi:outer membrane murein-binding lipoprotein Lpp
MIRPRRPIAESVRRALVRLATPAAVMGTALAAGCASDGKNMYEAPPNDGSANANSADVVTEPAITPK